MKSSVKYLFAVMFCFLWVVSAQAQFEMRRPTIQGVWSPEVGKGAVYSIDAKRADGGPTEMEMAVVGTETFEGKTGHWLETAMKTRREGQMVMKMLMVQVGKELQVKRMIMQMGDEPPMEFPVEMMQRGQQQAESADFREKAEKIGTETITTPAGTFECEHWRSTERNVTADVWFAASARPYGLVKTTSTEGGMTLIRLIDNAKSKIRGIPQKLDIQQMMRDRP